MIGLSLTLTPGLVMAVEDTSAPVISAVASTIGTTTTITWQTDELANSVVEYGPTNAYGTLTDALDTAPLALNHTVTIAGLTACQTYYYRVLSTDTFGNTGMSAEQYLFSGECSSLYPALNSACDSYNPNSEIHIRSASDITTKRAAAIADLWRVGGLPTRQPDTVTLNTGTTIPAIGEVAQLDTSQMDNLSNIDYLDIEMEGGFNSRVYLLKPIVSNNRLVIFHQGHANFGLNEYGSKETIENFIARGFYVLAMQMPMTGPNDGPVADRVSEAHNNMAALATTDFNPMKIFIEPVIIALNYTQANYLFQDVTMTGISGGGWTTVVASAIDTRINTSFPVAGSYPLDLRNYPCSSHNPTGPQDYEQGTTGDPLNFFTNVASYLDLYLLASSNNRTQLQLLSQYDECCFDGMRYQTYASTVADIANQLGGNFAVGLDVNNVSHQVTAWHIAQMNSQLSESITVSASAEAINVVEGDTTQIYTLMLDSQPIADVVVAVTLSDDTQGVTVSPTALNFTSTNWATPQTVTIRADNNNVIEDSRTLTLAHTVTSDDQLYHNVTIDTVTAIISDEAIGQVVTRVHPDFKDVDPADKAAYANNVASVVGGTNGDIIVTYRDASVYHFTVFALRTTAVTSVASFADSGYLIALHPMGKKLALVNVYTGKVFKRLTLTQHTMTQQTMQQFDVRADGTTEVIVSSSNKQQAQLAIVQVDSQANTLVLADRIKFFGEKITPQSSTVNTKKIILKRHNKTSHIVRIDPAYQLQVQ